MMDYENFIFIILPKWIPPFYPSKGDGSYNDPNSTPCPCPLHPVSMPLSADSELGHRKNSKHDIAEAWKVFRSLEP